MEILVRLTLTTVILSLLQSTIAKVVLESSSSLKIEPFADDDTQDPNVIFPMATTPLGQLRGQTMYSRSGRPFYAYRGIPYAKPPVRFEASLPVEPWGFLDARENGAVCPQVFGVPGMSGDENCLFLNVYVPTHDRCQNEESGKLPVYVHIHGGGYNTQSGSQFGPKYIMDECVVYVAINYRLGPLGFLTTGDDVIPGNLGMKDQVLAMQWIKQYITHFRGNPEIININGISGGGCSVGLLMTSPMAAGLFTSAIASSGNALSPFTITENPLKYANELGQKLGCSTATSTDLKACLLAADVEDIILNQDNGHLPNFGPIVEPKTAVNPFLTENPAVLLRNGDFHRVPLIIGFTEEEGAVFSGMLFADEDLTSRLNNSWNELAPFIFLYDDLGIDQSEQDRISTEIRQFYFGDRDVGQETRKELNDLYSDRYFTQSAFEVIALHSQFAPVYGYVMTYKGDPFASTTVGYEYPVITHGDDQHILYYPFLNLIKETVYGTEQHQYSVKMVTAWTQFAKTGDPSLTSGEGAWNTTTGETFQKLDLTDEVLHNYLSERTTFWRNLGLNDYELN